MTDTRDGSGWGLLALGLTLGLALVAGAAIGAHGLREVKREGRTLEVKGFAEKRISSDLAVWHATFTTRGAALPDAYAELERHRAALLAFLEQEQVPDDAFELMPVSTRVLFGRDERGHSTNDVEGYALSQQLRLSSGDVDRVVRVSKRASDLVKRGVELSSGHPQFLYTKLEDLKIAMLGEATEDAQRRARVLAEGSGSELGALRHARQGVFQITPAHSTEVSDYGRNDTTSREKSIKAVVTMKYAIEG